MSKVRCIYYAECADGLGAAWAVHHALGQDVEFVAAKYGDDPPTGVEGRDVLIVDFSYPLPVLHAMAKEARSVLVLDHHKTAQEDLVKLSPPSDGRRRITDFFGWLHWLNTIHTMPETGTIAAIFDPNRSGAGLAWDYLYPGTPRPFIIDLIEDRDLWKFRFSGETLSFHALLTSYDISDLLTVFERLDQ